MDWTSPSSSHLLAVFIPSFQMALASPPLDFVAIDSAGDGQLVLGTKVKSFFCLCQFGCFRFPIGICHPFNSLICAKQRLFLLGRSRQICIFLPTAMLPKEEGKSVPTSLDEMLKFCGKFALTMPACECADNSPPTDTKSMPSAWPALRLR